MNDPNDPYRTYHEGLLQVHAELASRLRALVAIAPLDVLVPRTLDVAGFLHGHHAVEDQILFPGLRRSGRLRSTDVAFLDACDRQHREVHAIGERLAAAAREAHPRAEAIRALVVELDGVLSEHLRDEEAGLAPERLREMIDRAGLDAIGHELDAMRRRFAAGAR